MRKNEAPNIDPWGILGASLERLLFTNWKIGYSKLFFEVYYERLAQLIGYHSRFFYYFLFSIKDCHARVCIWQFLYAPVSLYTPQTSREKLA